MLRLPPRHAVEARCVAQVLGRRHLLEERRLDGDPCDQLPHGPGLGEHVVAEDPRAAAVVKEQRRQEPDQSRLARAVLAEDGDRLSALHRERDALQRGATHAAAAATADELLAQVVDFNGDHAVLLETNVRSADTSSAPANRAARGMTGVSRGATSRWPP